MKNYLSHYNRYVLKEDKVYIYNTKYDNAIGFESNNIKEVKQFLSETNDKNLVDLGFIRTDKYEIEETKL